jgi:hypothetical protein
MLKYFSKTSFKLVPLCALVKGISSHLYNKGYNDKFVFGATFGLCLSFILLVKFP